MFKSIFKELHSLKKMSSEKKVKETLAKKLSGKKLPREKQLKHEVADNKSQFFNEIENKPNRIKNIKSNKNQETTFLSDDHINTTHKKTGTVKRSTRKIKTEQADGKKPTLEVELSRNQFKNKETHNTAVSKIEQTQRIKLSKTAKTSTKNKNVIDEDGEPCCSKKLKQESLDIKWEPNNWQIMLENIRKMRSSDKAPVDTMGCHKCADENADKKTQRFHKLVALMLSSQTKDETTYHAMLRLRENILIPEVICNMKVHVLENLLHPVSFYKNKAKYLQQTSKILIEKYNSDIPKNIKELVALPGVGPKMAHICMSTAWNEVTGIGVDVHVHRISNRLGWVPKPTKEPEHTRLALETWLPQHLWRDVNHLLVGFGQTTCTPVKPRCSECLNCEICPSASKAVKKM